MGLYSFKPRFTPHIRSGRKKHTIRAKRKDGWVEKPGNTMYLYENLRTKKSKHIGDRECVKVQEIAIQDGPNMEFLPDDFRVFIEHERLDKTECESLARADGFENFSDMMTFWDGRLPFEGHIIHWK